MMQLTDLIEISRYYGSKKEYVIAGGGNTSFKDKNQLWIKASGVNLSTIDESGFCVLDRAKLNEIPDLEFSDDQDIREEQVKNALLNSRTDPASGLRPSVETSLHNLFDYSFVVHTHATLVNGLMCSNDAEKETNRIFGNEVLYVPYTDPGYVLFMRIKKEVEGYRNQFGKDPQVVLLQNHGIFVAADSIAEIKTIYEDVNEKLSAAVSTPLTAEELPVSEKMTTALPALRMLLSKEDLKVASVFNNTVVNQFITSAGAYTKGIAKPFNPDQMVYCGSEYLYLEDSSSVESIVAETKTKTEEFITRKGALPKVIFVKNEGVVVVEDSAKSTDVLNQMVTDFCTISAVSQHFGGPHPLTQEQAAFIENWEVENYRKKIAKGGILQGRTENKIIIVTGGAQGFGAGIAEILFREGANIIIADLNEEKGIEFAGMLNAQCRKNSAHFIKVNVGDADSVKSLVNKTVQRFGGLDVMISNAGILRAGSLEEMEQDTFELMTKVNYTGYFLCAKFAKPVMKMQHEINPDHYMDIIQINSKSGLKGSNKNFAYAGGKFGGIGLTQSFALELMPYNIKVNSICPGNFFDGPLWSDPENGLFVQYLKAGKVPDAKTIQDVKAFYESQVPAGRGCTAEDVARAIFYVIEQQYETGQAVPVTGGQNMLN